MEEKKQKKIGTLCCIAGAMSWGFSGTCGEAFFKEYEVNPSWVTALRMTVAGVLLLIWVLSRKELNIRQVIKDRTVCVQIVIFALLGLALSQYSYLNAIRWTNSGTATVLQNLSIIFIAVFVCVSTKKLPQKRTVLCIALAIVGVWLISTGGKPGNMEITPKGLFWGITAAIGSANYSILSRKPTQKLGSIPVTGMAMLIGGIVLSLVVQVWNIPSGLDLKAILLLGGVVIIGTVGAFTLFVHGINLVGPVKASLYACLEPLTAATLSALWLHSSFSATDLVGFACILVTVFLI